MYGDTLALPRVTTATRVGSHLIIASTPQRHRRTVLCSHANACRMCWHWWGRLSCKVHLAQLPVSPVLVLWTTIHTPRMTWFLRRGHRQVVTSGEPSNCHDKRFSFLCRTCAARASLEFVPRDPPIACLSVRCITQHFGAECLRARRTQTEVEEEFVICRCACSRSRVNRLCGCLSQRMVQAQHRNRSIGKISERPNQQLRGRMTWLLGPYRYMRCVK